MTSPPGLLPVHTYHDGTKHHFHQYARSAGFLDWASQPNPFRSFGGAPVVPLYPDPAAPPIVPAQSPLTATVVGDVLRHSLGLSAWKQFHGSRWSLRVNPSSGNLHPTEAYAVAGSIAGLGPTPAVYHYAPDRHALEQRCAFGSAAWSGAVGDPAAVWLIALSSIHWREAWKYGERAFRYCQHDMGHAVATVRIAAALAGWSAVMLPDWSHGDIAALTGIDRDEDYVDAEREDAGCVLLLSPQHVAPRTSHVALRTSHVAPRTSHAAPRTSDVAPPTPRVAPRAPDVAFRTQLLTAAREGRWSGRASQLSEDHVQWTFIDEIARATEDPGRSIASIPPIQLPDDPRTRLPSLLPDRALVLQRRSAVSLDGRSSIDARSFFAILSRVMPTAGPPWDALWWDSRIHLALFVHRVDQVDPGLYLLARTTTAVDRLKSACRRTFLWEPVSETLPLFRLARGDCRPLARRVSCNQEIAADGFFSLGMIADFDQSLQTFGPAFYRHLFWESGVVGQVLYLEAEAAGARGTGIGCFFDDPVHDVLGITDHQFQSLYHFTIGVPVEDTRLTTEPGYAWERGS